MPYFNHLQNLTLENIYKFKLALFIHKIKNDPINIPAIFSGTLTLVSEVHSYNTRFATNFNIYRPSISNNYGATTFSFVASKIWESIHYKRSTSFIVEDTSYCKKRKKCRLNQPG